MAPSPYLNVYSRAAKARILIAAPCLRVQNAESTAVSDSQHVIAYEVSTPKPCPCCFVYERESTVFHVASIRFSAQLCRLFPSAQCGCRAAVLSRGVGSDLSKRRFRCSVSWPDRYTPSCSITDEKSSTVTIPLEGKRCSRSRADYESAVSGTGRLGKCLANNLVALQTVARLVTPLPFFWDFCDEMVSNGSLTRSA